ncbi:hypothetical protein TSUD_351610 [Trifolium subterraneum]|uniref:Uncharacterized protein n=1 Tax=Trifolium subterraneum TaxID=3900 RepID=A0A2Z6NMY3_TRISU|nr:hypothetical protein TSUD_351610 [Trifolium subterraneum]
MFIPIKQDTKGKKSGFVRFVEVVDTGKLLKKIEEILFGTYKEEGLDRSHKGEIFEEAMLGVEVIALPTLDTPSEADPHDQHSPYPPCQPINPELTAPVPVRDSSRTFHPTCLFECNFCFSTRILSSKPSPEWRQTMNEEIKTLEANNTWSLFQLPPELVQPNLLKLIDVNIQHQLTDIFTKTLHDPAFSNFILHFEMASFLCDLVKPYVEKVINGAIAEARHVFCFTCLVKKFEEERARLEPERITMVQRAKVAIERDKDIQANVGFWEEEIDKLNQVDTKTKQTCFFGFCPDCIWRYKRGKELANNFKEIKRLRETGEKLVNIELPRRLPDVERYSSKDYISFESRESKYKELLDALKDDNNYITGLQGMGGTGKTTLAKEVGKELKQSERFAHVVDTTVSFTPDIKKIQDDIAGPLGLTWENCNESDRPKKLWSRLTNGEKILLIMDDVWNRDPPLDFDTIGIPKQDNHIGCRVLVTSRNKQTFNIMDCDKIIELGLLSEEDAWIMFKRYARICNSSSKKLIDKGHKIAKECKQLPVAISIIASSLKGQQHREHEWDVTLKSLKKPISMHGVDDDMVGIYKCLKFSYDYLKDEKVKGLFLLCSVFREDEENSVEVLTRLCIGVGLFGEDYGSYDDVRNQVVVAKNKLIDSCLLLEVNRNRHKKLLKMHDLVRDAAQWIANKGIQCVNLFDKNQKSLVENQTNIKYLLCEGNCLDCFSLKFDGSKLETLIVKVDRDEDRKCTKVPNSFFENVIKLRVLYISGYYHPNYDQPLSLPDSIRSLTNIRSMLFDRVDLGDISILGNLQSLETLDFAYCTINELPNNITKLRKFKLLKLEYCKIRMNNPFEVIERCSSLEELYFKDSFNGFCQEITLPEFQRYHILNSGNWNYIPLTHTIDYQKYVLFYGDETCQFSNGTLKYCMQTTEALSLLGIKGGWRNLMPEIIPVELGMNDLVELRLRRISQLRCLIDTIGSQVPNVLSKLVVLELEEMENLEELFIGPLSFESLNNLENLSIKDCKHLRSLFKGKLNLCNLKTITLKNCPMLVSLFEVSISRSLVLLETLTIVGCEGLETIIADERREDEEIDDSGNNKSHGSVFPKLKVIDIKRCHRLESILPSLSAQDLPALKTIRIRKCDGLKYVFGKSQHVELVSLSELELSKLPNFIGIFEECNHLMSSCVKGSSSTSNYGSKAEIQLDPIKCNTFSWWTHICCHTTIPLVNDVDGDQPHEYSVASDYITTLQESNSYRLNIWERAQYIPIKSKILCNIKEITLTCLPKMKSVIILSIAPIMLLETLTIKNCDGLKHIIIDIGDHNTGGNNLVIVFPKLKRLNVKDCAQLEYIFGHDTSDHQNHVVIQLHLTELRHLYLCNLPSLVAMCPKQYQTTFPSLAKLDLGDCSQLDIKSIFHSISESLDNTIIKELSGNVDHFLTLEILELPKLKALLITEANELVELFKSEDDQKVDIPNLNIVAFDMLPSLCCAQGNQFQAVKNRIVRNCQKLTLTSASASITDIINERHDLCSIDRHLYWVVEGLIIQAQQQSAETTEDESDLESVENDGIEQLPSAETTEDFGLPSVENVPDLAILPTNSKIQMKQTPEVEHEFLENVPDLAIIPVPPNSEVRDVVRDVLTSGTSFGLRQNFNWYQSRHPVLYLGELQGRYFLALWTRKKEMMEKVMMC